MDNGASSYRRFLDGDDSGMVELIRDYKDGLIFYLQGFVGNILVAEDLMEETFVKLAIKRPRFSGKSTFKTWLYAIGRNVAMDYGRKKSRRREVPLEEAWNLLAEEESLEQSYLKEERKIVIHRALAQLKPEYRQILYLVYFEEFSNKEAAEIMKISRPNADNLISRARASLKSILEKEGFADEEL